MSEIGKRYGKLVVLEQAESYQSHKKWLCRCDCGNERVVWQVSLRRGSTVSCGCHARNNSKKRWAEHQKDGKGFWAKVDKSGGPASCWEWQGTTMNGYGGTSYKGRPYRAHRLAWLLTHGELDPNCVMRHKCDNKRCCNPAHLQPGTQLENIQDIVDRGLCKKGQNKGAKNGRAKLNYEAAECIRRGYGSGLSQDKLAYIFGVSQQQISKIVRDLTYTEPDIDHLAC